jgi:hypothetical protein
VCAAELSRVLGPMVPQVVVEKLIKAETGQSRHDLGREKFLERAWEWKHKYVQASGGGPVHLHALLMLGSGGG